MLWKGGTYFLKNYWSTKISRQQNPTELRGQLAICSDGSYYRTRTRGAWASSFLKIFDQTELGIDLHGFSERFTQNPNQEKYY